MKNIVFALSFTVLCAACGRAKEDFDASGRFEATETIVSSEVAGRLVSFDVAEGQHIAAGEVVGVVDTVQLVLRIEQLKAAMRAADSRRTDISRQVAVTQQQIATQTVEQKRFEQLIKADAANQKQLDDINAQIALLERQLAAQQSTLESSNRGLDEDARGLFFQVQQLQDQLLKSRITSPATGIVTAKYAETGEMATVGKPLFKVADVDGMYLRAYITANQLTQLKLGQGVKVYADFGKKDYREYKGVITWVSDTSEFTPKSIQTRDERADLVYAVKISVPNDGYLKIGMYGQVKFAQEE